MGNTVRILAFSGSTRRESFNRKLLAALVEATRRIEGAEVTLVDLTDFPAPIYNGDWEDEHGLPEGITRLVEQMQAHDALLIASPEYNSYFTPLLKNTIDWCTRSDADPFEGKVAAVASASPSMHGGLRSMTHLRALLTHLGSVVVPVQCILPHANKAFDEHGRLTVERSQQAVERLAQALVDTTRRLKSTAAESGQ